MMNRKEFYEYVKDNVKEYLPESYKDAEIKLQEVEKNNGLNLRILLLVFISSNTLLMILVSH
jgi:hypothetical protein